MGCLRGLVVVVGVRRCGWVWLVGLGCRRVWGRWC